jgi:hypothetical protein
MHVGFKSSWELMFALFVNVPTLNKTFDLIWFEMPNKKVRRCNRTKDIHNIVSHKREQVYHSVSLTVQ